MVTMNVPLFACIACGLLISLANPAAAYPQKENQPLSEIDIYDDLTVILPHERFSTRIYFFLKVLKISWELSTRDIMAKAYKLDPDNVLAQKRIADIKPEFESLSVHLNAGQKYRISHLLPIICGVDRFRPYLQFVLGQNVAPERQQHLAGVIRKMNVGHIMGSITYDKVSTIH